VYVNVCVCVCVWKGQRKKKESDDEKSAKSNKSQQKGNQKKINKSVRNILLVTFAAKSENCKRRGRANVCKCMYICVYVCVAMFCSLYIKRAAGPVVIGNKCVHEF